MEWHIMNTGGLNSLSSNLGMVENGVYVPTDNSQETLEEYIELLQQDSTQKTYRRVLFNNNFPEKELIPLIRYIKDDHGNKQAATRLMMMLTHPAQFYIDKANGMIAGPPWAIELDAAIKKTVESCFCKEFVDAILDEIRSLIEENGPYDMMDDHVTAINTLILLIRNLLYMSDTKPEVVSQSIQRISILLDCGYEEVLVSLLHRKELEKWCSGIIQLNWLIYKGKVDMLFPQVFRERTRLPAVIECEPCHARISNSDASETFSLQRMFHHTCSIEENHKLMDMLTDAEDSGESRTLTKASMLEFREKLSSFTKNILQEGFMCVLTKTLENLIRDKNCQSDEAYLFWMLTLFIRFANSEGLPVGCVKELLTGDIVGYLVYKIFTRAEELFSKPPSHGKNTQMLQLMIDSLKGMLEYLFDIQENKVKELNEEEVELYDNICMKLANMNDLHNLMVFLIRNYDVDYLASSFLQDVIFMNHLLLLQMENWISKGYASKKMLAHVKQFATYTIMRKYGALLETFAANSSDLNTCLFTMMHHIAGDCGSPEVLLQRPVLEALLEIDKEEMNVSEEVGDLAEYIISKFISDAEKDPFCCASKIFGEGLDSIGADIDLSIPDTEDDVGTDWTSDDEDLLVMVYMDSEDSGITVEHIVHNFEEAGRKKTVDQIVHQLSVSNWLDDEDKAKLLGGHDIHGSPPNRSSEVQSPGHVSEQSPSSGRKRKHNLPDIGQDCINKLRSSGLEASLSWLQTVFCEAAYIKLNPEYIDKNAIEEPIAKYHVLQNKSVPIVGFNEEQEGFLKNSNFCTLLEYLGMHMPEDVNLLYPRIPHFFNSKQLTELAGKLGSLDKVPVKFDVAVTEKLCDDDFLEEFESVRKSPRKTEDDSSPSHRFNSIPETGLLWTDLIQNFNQK